MKRSLLRLSLPFREPFVTAGGVVSARELVVLRLEASDGTVGWGEAAPFEPYDGVPLERAIAALSGGGGRRPPQARAAEEIARLDIEARQEGRPLAEPRRDFAALPDQLKSLLLGVQASGHYVLDLEIEALEQSLGGLR